VTARTIIVGIDTGGTFTDLVMVADGRLRVHKVPSTPDDPTRAVVTGLKAMLESDAGRESRHPKLDLVTYSSTVATNALLERKGARVLLITNAGFEDLVEIGRQNRSELYALAPERPEPLVPRAMRLGVAERTHYDGTIARALGAGELRRVRSAAARSRADSIAVCLLHSYANAASERRLARALAPLGLPLSVSHRILAEYREFERLSTTVVNAYVAPRMSSHLARLERSLGSARLRVMQSNGSAITHAGHRHPYGRRGRGLDRRGGRRRIAQGRTRERGRGSGAGLLWARRSADGDRREPGRGAAGP
jgi:N-methylhydantoinase A/oxoprolinase/acetone carboxylase beta subunit